MRLYFPEGGVQPGRGKGWRLVNCRVGVVPRLLAASTLRIGARLSGGWGVSKTLPGRSPTGLTPVISGVLKCRDDMTGENTSPAEGGGPAHMAVVGGGVREGRGGAKHAEEAAVVVVLQLVEVLRWGVPPRWGVMKL